jgi:hypothetical protein
MFTGLLLAVAVETTIQGPPRELETPLKGEAGLELRELRYSISNEELLIPVVAAAVVVVVLALLALVELEDPVWWLFVTPQQWTKPLSFQEQVGHFCELQIQC